ncbi:MAG TPA: hypothetical protein VF292_07015 [Rhodanobacteraceae bacterium]
MATSRNRKPVARHDGKKVVHKTVAKLRGPRGSTLKTAVAKRKGPAASVKKPTSRTGVAKVHKAAGKTKNGAVVGKTERARTTGATAVRAKAPAVRSASVKSAARAVAAARGATAKRRPPSYIPRSHFHDDWMLSGPVELPRQPNPAAHAPVRKPPKPRAPKPKAISHEQAVANLKALLESRKRKDRGGAAKSA